MIPLYEDSEGARPLIYIDQNIIDSVRKGVYSFDEDVFSKRFRAIYSDETFREIRRAEQGGGNPARYLEVLEKFEAYHLQLQLNGQFAPTGNAIIRTHNPTEAYESFMQQIDLDYLIEANLLINQKIMGGLPELTVEDIAQIMLDAFERNAKSIEENIKNLEPFFPNAKEELPQLFNSLGRMKAVSLEEYKGILKGYVASLKNSLKLNETSQSALNRYREELKLSPKNLNNIKPPHVVEQVWQVISRDENITQSGITINQFFGLDNPSPIHPERNSFVSEQVASIYVHLNLAGYYPDKGLNQTREFASSFSDMQHVSLATHCNYLLSSDERLIKKASAAYEYTGARTQALPLSLPNV